MKVNKVKYYEVQKDKVTREVAKMYKDLEFSVRADAMAETKNVFSEVIGGDDSCCLGGDEHVGGQGGGLRRSPGRSPIFILPNFTLYYIAYIFAKMYSYLIF